MSAVFYADDPVKHRRSRAGLLRYIRTRRVPRASVAGAARQPDPHLRQRVERAAVRVTIREFSRLGYTVRSVERDNLGWDLDAVNTERELRLEVKGLSGPEAVVDLTPNEYAAMQRHRDCTGRAS